MEREVALRKAAIILLVLFWVLLGDGGICHIWSAGSGRYLSGMTRGLMGEVEAGELRPTAYSTDYPDKIATSDENGLPADLTIDADAFPIVTYHNWETTLAEYSSLSLCVDRFSEGLNDDKWGIKYSVDGGNKWMILEGMSPSNVSVDTICVSLALPLDLTRLQVRIDSDKKKRGDAGLLHIHDIWAEGIPYGDPFLTQSGYRFFASLDSVDPSAIVNDINSDNNDRARAIAIDGLNMYVAGYQNPGLAEWRVEKRNLETGNLALDPIVSTVSGADEASAIAIDDEFMYVAGFEPGRWRIEKRNLSDVSDGPVYSRVSDLEYAGNAKAIAIADRYMFIVGDEYSGGDYRWRIEKRRLDSGDPDEGFGINGDGVVTIDPSDGNDSANALAIDSTRGCLYVIGNDRSNGPEDAQWRIEEIDLETGELLSYAVSNPSIKDDIPMAIAIDSDFMYVVGYDRIPGSTGKPGKDKRGSSNPEWRIEKRSLDNFSDLSDWEPKLPSDEFGVARGIAIDSQYMYVIGSQELGFFDTAWRIEKRELSTLGSVSGFGDDNDGVIVRDIGYDDQPEAIAIDSSFMYVVGYSAMVGGGGDTAWHIEKRSLDDGSPAWLRPLQPPPSLSNNDEFRLRLLMHVGSDQVLEPLLQGVKQFKLQFGKIDDSTDGEFISLWEDVTDESVIAFKDNPSPGDGDPLGGTGEDPFHEDPAGYIHPTRNQTYEETLGFTNSESTVPAGEDGMWDFSLRVNGAPLGTYCFRIVEASGTELEYASYPQVQIQ